MIALQNDVYLPFDRGQGIGDRGGAAAQTQKSTVVLRVADADNFVRRQVHFPEGGAQAARLVDAGGQDHNGALVEDYLQIQTALPDGVAHDRLVLLPRRHDHAADGKRLDTGGLHRSARHGLTAFAETVADAADRLGILVLLPGMVEFAIKHSITESDASLSLKSPRPCAQAQRLIAGQGRVRRCQPNCRVLCLGMVLAHPSPDEEGMAMITVYFFSLAFAMGMTAGLRSLTAPMVVSWAARLGWIDVHDTWAAFLSYAALPYILTLLANAELVVDKLPTTPRRTALPSFTFRVLSGAFAGAALAAGAGQTAVFGAVCGGLGAVAGTLGGYQARTRLVQSLKVPDFVIAVLEDAVAVGSGFFLVARF